MAQGEDEVMKDEPYVFAPSSPEDWTVEFHNGERISGPQLKALKR